MKPQTIPRVFAIAVLLSAAFLCTADASKSFTLSLIHTSGTNSSYTTSKYNNVNRNFGGYAALKTAVDTIKANLTAPGIFVHGINALGFSTFSQHWQGLKESEYLEDIGFQYTAFGTRDFFYGPEAYANNFLANSSFAGNCIASNALISKSLALAQYVTPYRTLTFTDGISGNTSKVVLLSFISDEFCTRSRCSAVQGNPIQVKIANPISAMKTFVADVIFTENPDVIIAMSANTDYATDLQIAQSVPGIDILYVSDDKAIIEGTDYPRAVTGPTGDTVLLINDQTSITNVDGLGHLRVTFKDGVPYAWNGTLDPVMSCQDDPSPLNSTCYVPDPTLKQRLDNDLEPVYAALNITVGSLLVALNGAQGPAYPCRTGECSSGSALADAMLWKMDAQCDAAMVNGGSIRASVPAGNVTLMNFFNMLPNKNNIAVARMRGADILDSLNNGLSRINASGSGRFPQVANLIFTYNSNNLATLRLTGSVMIYNKTLGEYVELDPEGEYNLCVNDYMRGGGDGYTALQTKAISAFDQGPPLDVVLREYVSAYSPLSAPVSGRIRDLAVNVSGTSPPLTGSCTFTMDPVTSASGNVTDVCAGGYRYREDVTWTISPLLPNSLQPRSIYLRFSNLALNPSTDTLYIRDGPTQNLLTVRSPADNVTLVPANYTTLPDRVDVPNAASLLVRLVTNRPLDGESLRLQYTADTGCPGGYLLGTQACLACTAGTFAQKDDSVCTPCPAGSITATDGMAACTQCAPGTFADHAGQSRCKTCDGGRIWNSAQSCECPAGNYWNDFTCLPIPASHSETGQIAGIAVGLVVAAGGIAFYVHRRRMGIIKRRQMGTRKQTELKADVAMKHLLHDIATSLFLIAFESGDVATDWIAFLGVHGDNAYKVAYIIASIFGSVITFISAAIRIYNIYALFKIRRVGIKLVASGAKATSFEAMERVKDAQNDSDLHLALLNLRTLRQKVIITIAVAAPGVLKGLPIFVVNALVGRSQGIDMPLMISFGFNALVFSNHVKEVCGWFALRHLYAKQKLLADKKLAERGLQRPDAAHRLMTHRSSVGPSKAEVEIVRSSVIVDAARPEIGEKVDGGAESDSEKGIGPTHRANDGAHHDTKHGL
ncbi:uncharacterized protein SPPG_01727 [Spizellomyces punctatus DAOM BR117]|uniref:5'-Nucleotidase C-terminal domain-containing protein n=1 Tax=Spizellomyces punctatus (strain DAOM BR117) TaxID=645134 RepID=A0A0L0HPC1_SPIPD|nr:uncharacterized protein SPPG_01727 [Spizellomyces punctatus DAOM BR117]KND02639.1 hypothetical protein SPPG_01727 [Spizellomyces punctatus DAOM BR117]|eukprot:XP_016610678.1 hypothetical protein SPPG_01727 [Spizellomyces punctatus DAOM BR117]